MRRAQSLTAMLLFAAGIVSACSAGASPSLSAAPSAAVPGASVMSSSGAVTIGTASSGSLGPFLTGSDGKTLYTYAGDSMNVSTRTGSCLAAWPPLTVVAGQQPTAGAGVTGTLGTFTRADGTTQVTYNGLPLYGWQGDAKPGDATGNAVGGFSVAAVAGSVPAPSRSGGSSY